MNYIILVDASCDIEDSYVESKDITVLRMDYFIDDEHHIYDGTWNDETMSEFYGAQKKGAVTKTSQITPYLYEEFFNELLKDCDGLLYISLSSGLTSTYQSALIGAKNVLAENQDKTIQVLDSRAASCGIGLLGERAVKNRNNGMSIEDNYEDLLKLRDKVRHYFIVDDLMYLKRGGRISTATALVGTAIGIKPVLKIDPDGKLETFEKKKGSLAAANYVFDLFINDVDKDGEDTIYVVDSNNQKMSDYLSDKIAAQFADRNICAKRLSPIIGAHTGPGLAAIVYVSK